MTTSAPAPSLLLQKLSRASKAAINFTEACKRVYGTTPTESGPAETSELTGRDLKTWREATEALQVAIGTPEGSYFFSHNDFDTLDVSHTWQVNVINLGVILEMFLPSELRLKYPQWTSQTPLIDPDYGSSQEYTLQEKVELFEIPLNQLKPVLLRLCAGMTDSRMQVAIKQILIDISMMTHFVTSKALGKPPLKTTDMMRYFNPAFLRDPSLVPSVFKNEAKRSKAEQIWEDERVERLKRLEFNPPSSGKYTWESTSQLVLEKLCRLAVKHAVTRAREELDEVKSKANEAHNTRQMSIAQTSATISTREPLSTSAKPQVRSGAFDPYLVTPRNPGSTPPPPEAPAPVRTLRTAPVGSLETPLEHGFVFNAPQANAEKVTMTPSPTSSPAPTAEGPRHAQSNAKSVLQKLKKNIPLDRNRSRTISASTNKSKEVSVTSSREQEAPAKVKRSQGVAATDSPSKRKRRVNEDAAQDEDEEDTSRKAKKRRVDKEMPPPTAIPSKKGASSVVDKPADTSSSLPAATGRPPRDFLLSRPTGSSAATLVQSPTDTSSDESDIAPSRAQRLRNALKRAEIAAVSAKPPPATAASLPTREQPAVASTSKATAAVPRDGAPSVTQSTTEATARSLGIQAARTGGAKERIAAIRADEEAAKRRALAAAEGRINENEEVDSEEEWRRKKAASLQRVVEEDSDDELQQAKKRMQELKKRAQEPPPLLKRAKHLPVLSEDEEEEGRRQETEAERKKKRGRPRKEHRSPSPEIV
ncbi:hypothetical protein FRC17_005579, partial [Serendipita sp. 399]